MEALIAQLAVLQAAFAETTTRIAALEREVVLLRAENDALRADNDALRAENAALKAENARLRAENDALRAENAALRAEVEGLKRERDDLIKKVRGRTSERTKGDSGRDGPPSRAKNDEAARAARAANRDARRNACPVEEVLHPLPDADKVECSFCGSPNISPMPAEAPSEEYEYVPGRLIRRRHSREKACCKDCGTIHRAPAPTRIIDGAQYGPGFVARTVVSKLLDCLPFYRQAKIWARDGFHVSPATLMDLFHMAAGILKPLHGAMCALVAQADLVFADETTLKLQDRKKVGFVWTFICGEVTLYQFATGRSGKTPVDMLGESSGFLVVDGYSGYNHVCTPDKRVRAGCNAHARRKFVGDDDAGAKQVVDKYRVVWEVEREAVERGIAGTEAHLAMRRDRSRPALEAIKKWCDDHGGRYGPKEPVGKAITYFVNQWPYLIRFLDDVRIPPDNNLSERMLRLIALGRKNYLFVGNETAGQNLAVLMSIVTTCVQHDVDPQAYLTDVLLRVQTHPASDVRALLPDAWKEARASEEEAATA